MTLLSDHDIIEVINGGVIDIRPRPRSESIQPASVDLHLSPYVYLFRTPSYSPMTVDPYDSKTYDRIGTPRQIPDAGYVFHPGQFFLGSTLERVRLDKLHSGRLEGKSSLGRLGVMIHSTAGFVDPGFDGHLTLEITIQLPRSVRLYAGMPICQLALFRLSSPVWETYAGKYQYQGIQPQPSLYSLNRRSDSE